MKRNRYGDRGDAVRRLLAWQEERMMLYRELAKVQESLLRDLAEESIGPGGVLDQMEKEMTDCGIIAKEHGV